MSNADGHGWDQHDYDHRTDHMMTWFTLLLGASGWILLQVSHRREAEPVLDE